MAQKRQQKKPGMRLLSTKISLPYLGLRQLERPRLEHLLDSCPPGGIASICAPAGFGKSSLVRAWIEYQDDLRAGWLSLDEQDNNFQRFLRYLVGVCQKLAPELQDELGDSFSAQPTMPVEPLLETLLDGLAGVPEPFVLVLDNLQVIDPENAAPFEALTFFLTHFPSQGRALLLSRSTPPLPLLQWRVKQRLLEISAVQLRFTFQETSDLLQEYLQLEPSLCEKVYEKMGGWAAGLQLAMLSLEQEQNKAELVFKLEGTQREVEAYLGAEIFHHQPKDIREFLLKTSVLQRFNAPLCDAVLGGEGSQQLLKVLEKDNLFLKPLDVAGQWYEYEELFLGYLRDSFERDLSEQEQKRIHRAASRWFAGEKMLDEAIHHAFRAQDYDLATELMTTDGFHRIYQVDWDTLLRWLAQFPREIYDGHLQLRLFRSYVRGMGAQWDAVAEMELEHTEALLQERAEEIAGLEGEEHEAAALEFKSYTGQVSWIRASVEGYRRNYQASLEHAQNALLHLIEVEEKGFLSSVVMFHIGFCLWQIHGNVTIAKEELSRKRKKGLSGKAGGLRQMYLYVAQTDVLLVGGQLHQVMRLSQEMIDSDPLRAVPGRLSARSVPLTARKIAVEYEWNCFEPKATLAMMEVICERSVGRSPWRELEWYLIIKTFVQQASGDLEGAQATLDWAREQQPPELRGTLSPLSVCQARLWLWKGEHEAANHWGATSGLSHEDQTQFQHESAYLTYARVLLHTQRPEHALQLLETLERDARECERMGRVLESLLLQSLALSQMEKTEDAWRRLLEALELGQPQDYVRVFVDEGASMKGLLLSFLKAAYRKEKTGPTPYIQKLLAAFPPDEELLAQEDESGLTAVMYERDPLSDRETEILALAATGLSYRSIAKQLGISPATVKRHMNNIYSKLGVHNRNDAISYAKKMKILM